MILNNNDILWELKCQQTNFLALQIQMMKTNNKYLLPKYPVDSN